MASDWRNDEARARGRFRRANERVVSAFERRTSGVRVPLVCECGNEACEEPLDVTLVEYEAVRVHPRRFLIAVNHENPEVETIVSETEDFAIVETLAGVASRVAEETDPRAEPLEEEVRGR